MRKKVFLGLPTDQGQLATDTTAKPLERDEGKLMNMFGQADHVSLRPIETIERIVATAPLDWGELVNISMCLW